MKLLVILTKHLRGLYRYYNYTPYCMDEFYFFGNLKYN